MAHLIHNRAGKGEIEHFSIHHEHARGIYQCQYGGIDCDVNEIDRVLKILLRKISQTQKIDSMASRPASANDADTDFICSSRNDQSEARDVLPVMTCDEGDGGHRCPYFPCPYCHRSRSIYVAESNTTLMITCGVEHEVIHQETPVVPGESNPDCTHVITCDEGDGGHRCPYFPCPYCHRSRSIFVPESKTILIIACEEHEVIHQETPNLVTGQTDADGRHVFFNMVINDQSVPAVTCDEGDGGHRCPYFPCPYCHHSMSIFVPETDDNVDSPNLDCKSNLDMISDGAHDMDNNLMSRSDDLSGNIAAAVACPDKGHTCPYFPCPICHRTR